MVPITFRFNSPLTWCHRRSITPSWNLSTIVSWSSSTFWALPEYQLNSWWEIPPLPLYDLCYHRQHYCLPSDTNLIMLWSSLLSSLCYVLPWSITVPYVKDVARMTPPLKNCRYCDASRHHPSFGPRVASNRNTNKWTLPWDFSILSNLIASELMDNNSNLVCWLLNHHSDVGRAS